MNLLLAIAVVVVTTTAAITVMLVVRRHAPDGSFFNDGDRAAGVFGVLATGFAVLIGFVVFLAFTSYDTARAGAETEALIVAQQLETAQFFEPATASQLTAGLVCYARSVAGVQWQRMEDDTIGDTLNPWAVRLFETVRATEPTTAAQQSAYDRWLDQTTQREQARNDRIHGAVGVIPTTLWIVLFFTAALIFAYVLFFADRGEGAVTQAMLMGSVVAVIVMLLLLLRFLDSPVNPGVGSLEPVAMQRTLLILENVVSIAGQSTDYPCDERGTPT